MVHGKLFAFLRPRARTSQPMKEIDAKTADKIARELMRDNRERILDRMIDEMMVDLDEPEVSEQRVPDPPVLRDRVEPNQRGEWYSVRARKPRNGQMIIAVTASRLLTNGDGIIRSTPHPDDVVIGYATVRGDSVEIADFEATHVIAVWAPVATNFALAAMAYKDRC